MGRPLSRRATKAGEPCQATDRQQQSTGTTRTTSSGSTSTRRGTPDDTLDLLVVQAGWKDYAEAVQAAETRVAWAERRVEKILCRDGRATRCSLFERPLGGSSVIRVPSLALPNPTAAPVFALRPPEEG